MSPLLKNVGLAFVAGFVTTLSVMLPVASTAPSLDVLAAVGAAAVYAGVRGAVGYLKERYGSGPFGVDTEA